MSTHLGWSCGRLLPDVQTCIKVCPHVCLHACFVFEIDNPGPVMRQMHPLWDTRRGSSLEIPPLPLAAQINESPPNIFPSCVPLPLKGKPLKKATQALYSLHQSSLDWLVVQKICSKEHKISLIHIVVLQISGMPTPTYQLPFQSDTGVHPSLDEMQLLVARRKVRPKFPDVWKDSNPVSSHPCFQASRQKRFVRAVVI